ncbi:membrane protein insertase YidC [Desulfomarina profundi]|uniref:Membrane protein insertase YidC n=1 Tax=Desulfomarina profundi TaxID=2772557 RepID=A0A8D5FF88_9BACT|nr:membrane protein insertase YidC [Desulfomarina profundi]BCL59410.1 membrane protein insertase YidC [Desulfomarina profundi]
MDTYRAFLAIVISFVILVGYQYFFVGFDQPVSPDKVAVQNENVAEKNVKSPAAQETVAPAVPVKTHIEPPAPVYDREAKNIIVETDLYSALLSEDGGTVKSFRLKKHKETHDPDSPGMELVKTDDDQGYPLEFSWGSALGKRVLYDSERQEIHLSRENGKAVLRMTANGSNGLLIEREYSFDNETYLVDLTIRVKNSSMNPLQGIPQLYQINSPFMGNSGPTSRYLFSGPVAFVNGELETVKAKEFKDGPKTIKGAIDWAGYEGNYFLCGIVPIDGAGNSFTMEGDQDLTRMQLAGDLDTLQPGGVKEYKYHLFYGPKKLEMLKSIGYNLDKAVNFGWFDVIAKPTLWLLNKFYSVFGNYGIAIILVTILFKVLFWPITQKGMKSMKNMQKLQPKMAKIKEKYKDDPTRMNQEVMSLYKTYKVNPLGGCLPMVLQIPVFFALYKVLLQSIELRHAPFMLWITDLSAPDRLYLGFDIPYLGGFPVLTVLMGASMFLQQKMSPSTADPTQAKIMMFLPLIFTFMFIKFASGLVLYWFINNLLSILQQVIINRETKKPAKA